MKTSSIVHTLDLSRRRVLHGAALAAGGAALLAGGLTGFSAVAASNKMSQKAAGYVGKPKGKQRCDNCVQWAPPASCNIVAGPIRPSGWCNLYVAKP